ncbi:hypothetical protein GM921_00925 [Pedobacter sp. LMG 31464]|uniref:Uncharacterized protein n=1 Tax=Pedobacter planticolens TaxID=2679964 RepID=A0A923DUD5_9SPHI|nr:hypothetical protein [Pedobacter planticolens]MBB2144034.1 hypothetical protein [Pedobacter planticolens]
MKNSLRIILFLLMPFCVCAQNLSDANSYKKALKLAEETHKPLLIIVSIKLPENVNIQVAPNLALKEPDVLKKMKDNFVVFNSDRSDTTMNAIIEKYKIRIYPTFLFLHPNGDAFHSEFGNMSNKNRYLLMLERAIALSKEKSITELAADYSANKTDNETLKKLIELRKRNSITDNAELIEKYVTNLKIDNFNNYEIVLFILEAGPFADGSAYKFAFSNKKITDSIYKNEPLQVRAAINNGIIENTMAKAIRDKNVNQAQAASRVANSNYSFYMLRYYKSVKDTANYLRNATFYYDSRYMNISADSIKKLEAKQQQIALDRNKQALYSPKTTLSQAKIDSIKSSPNTIVKKETISAITSSASLSNSYANSLNSAAWSFYETGTKNINYLLKAVTWSTRSIELNPSASYYDTLAHLFYQLRYFEQAVKTQQTAINQAKIEGRSYENLQEELKKMKAKSL